MDSSVIIKIHTVSVMLFLITYLIKTVLLFSNKNSLVKYSAATKIPEMIISALFLVTGIWLYVIIGGIKTFHILKLIFVILAIPLAVVGFKKMKKGLALLSLILIIGAYGIAEMSKSKPFIPANVAINNPSDITLTGQKVFMENCVYCHGADGKKVYRNAPDLTRSVFNEDAIKQMILEGSKGKMPAYKLIISDDNIAAVALYVKNMQSESPSVQ